MSKKKTKKKPAKKVTVKKTIKKIIKKKSLIKRIDDTNDTEVNVGEPFDKVKTEIIIKDGIVIVNPIYNPFDENNKD